MGLIQSYCETSGLLLRNSEFGRATIILSFVDKLFLICFFKLVGMVLKKETKVSLNRRVYICDKGPLPPNSSPSVLLRVVESSGK